MNRHNNNAFHLFCLYHRHLEVLHRTYHNRLYPSKEIPFYVLPQECGCVFLSVPEPFAIIHLKQYEGQSLFAHSLFIYILRYIAHC